MSRSQRLLQLIQLLREHRNPVSAAVLAEQLQISVRTVYRDIDTLNAQGASIEGEAGIGFQLRGGFLLPPMMWNADEIEAIILGARWVSRIPDEPMQQATTSILAKLQAVLPEQQQHLFEHTTLFAINHWLPVDQQFVKLIRLATRQQKKLRIHYINEQQRSDERIIWPVSIGYFQDRMLLAAWCELRQDFRHFRLDRVQDCQVLDEHYPPYKKKLFQQWWDSKIKPRMDAADKK